MDVRRVVPDTGQIVRRAVEDDRSPDEDEPLDVVLDRSELVRDVHDRHAELAVEPGEELGERLLRLGVDTGGRLVENEQGRLPGKRLGDECALLHPARQRAERSVCDCVQADAADRLVDEATIVGPQAPDETGRGQTPGADHLANGCRRISPDLRPLSEIPEPLATREAVGRLAVQERRAGARPFEAEEDAHERRLASSVRTRDGNELAFPEREVDILEHMLAGPVPEGHGSQLDG
jgi:hypothetical protein